MSQLTAKTWIPLGAVAGGAGMLVGIGIWVGGIQIRVTSAEAAVAKVEQKHEEAMREFRKMNSTLGEIVGELRSLRQPRASGNKRVLE